MLYEREAKIIISGPTPRIDQEVTGLRIAFDVDKSDGTELNRGLIYIYNAGPNIRARVAKAFPLPVDSTITSNQKTTVKLLAGYKDKAVQLIHGDVFKASNYRAGGDWITEIDIRSGMSVATTSDVQLSYNGQTSSKKIVEDMLAKMGIDIKYTPAALKAITGQSVPDYTSSGLALFEVNNFLSGYNLAFTIEEQTQGLIYVKKLPGDAESSRNNQNTFSIKNGLLGTPKITEHGVELRSLLRPTIRILQRINVESQSIGSTIQNENTLSNEFYVKKIKHIGDTRSDEWYTEIEAYYANLSEKLI